MGNFSDHPFELVIIGFVDQYLDFADKVRVRAVCSSWNSYLPNIPKLGSGQLPWLLQEDSAKGASLYTPHEAKEYPLNLPETKQKIFKGSSYGWVLTLEDVNSSSVDDIYLFNPLTRARIKLPPRSTFPDIKEYHPDRVGREYLRQDTSSPENYINNNYNNTGFVLDKALANLIMICKVVLSSPPSSDDCVVVAIYGEFYQLAWCRPHHKEWTPFTEYASEPPQVAVVDVIFHNGKLHALYANGKVVMFESIDPQAGIVEIVAEHQPGPGLVLTSPMYLVECCNLGIILATRYVDYDEQDGVRSVETTCFFLYKLADSHGSKTWVEVEDIGDNMLYLGLSTSLSIPVSDEFKALGYKRNCIYYTDVSRSFIGKFHGQKDSDIGICDLEDESTYRLPGFEPVPNFIWPPPIWVTPTAY